MQTQALVWNNNYLNNLLFLQIIYSCNFIMLSISEKPLTLTLTGEIYKP